MEEGSPREEEVKEAGYARAPVMNPTDGTSGQIRSEGGVGKEERCQR